MIQRIQSVWLLLASLVTCLLFVSSVYTTADKHSLPLMGNYASLLFTACCIVLPVVIVFMYKTRVKQITLSFGTIVLNAGNLTMLLYRVKTDIPVKDGSYGIGALLPVVSIIFLLLAIRAISKDDAMVKSSDRLR